MSDGDRRQRSIVDLVPGCVGGMAYFVNLVNELGTATEALDAVSVANRLRPVLLRLSRELRREAHSFGVTGGQASLLAVVERHRQIGLGELAAGEGVSAAAMSKHVDRLEAAGLVARTPGSSGDRRRVEIELTPAGGRVLRRVRSHRTAWLAARLDQLGAHELVAIDEAIEPLAALLEERP
jgi:DNA-binding MarR family transcriptional regulator